MGPIRIDRRNLAVLIGLGVYSFGDRLRATELDDLVSNIQATPDSSGELGEDQRPKLEIVEHWSPAKNSEWRWYERENLIEGVWKKTGVTRPIHRETGKMFTDRDGYLEESEIPPSVLKAQDRRRLGLMLRDPFTWQERHAAIKPATPAQLDPETMPILFGDRSASDAGRSSAERRGRHGRPPSRWLLSLTAEEIRTWLARVEIQDAFVRGMTYWTHLTRDHSFDPAKIRGLTEPQLAELHGAAHEGF